MSSLAETKKIYSEIVQEMKKVYLHDDRPWMIGYSGGKDSTLLVGLVFDMLKALPKAFITKKTYIISSDTGVENPIVGDYMHKMNAMIGEKGKELGIETKIIYPKVKNTFWSKVIGLGYPTPEPPGFRWCTERLKIEPMNDFTLNAIKNNGEVVLLLGVRKAESISRANNIKSREIEGRLLIPHDAIPKAYVYNPLTEIPNESVWEYLLENDGINPWGADNKLLYSMYQGEDLGEEKSVVGEIDKDKMPITGNSRFGCWICTMVKEDKSLKRFIDSGAKKLIPLRDFRNRLMEMRSDPKMRDTKRRNGVVYLKKDGEIGLGPFTMEARKKILRELLELENKTGFNLISKEELREIDRMWEADGDLSRRELVNIYFDVKKEKLPWDEFKTPIYSEEIIKKIKQACKSSDIEFEMISKLIVEIENNKHFTRTNMVNKAFDRVMNQGWLHFSSIQEKLKNEN